MRRTGARRRPILGMVRPAVTACAALAALAFALPAGGCGGTSAKGRPSPAAAAAVTTGEVRAFVDAALTQAAAHDAAGWRTALPARGVAIQTLNRLYSTLRAFSWHGLQATVEPIPREPARFDVLITGEPDGFGPHDRLIAERVLVVQRVAGSLTVTGDVTPPAVGRLYLAAFDHPMAIRAAGGLVIGERVWQPRLQAIADAVPFARSELWRVLRVRASRGFVVYVFDSRSQLDASFDNAVEDARINFISIDVQRLSTKHWWPRDVLVVAPALAGKSAWLPHMLAHEVTHGFTMRWFADTANAPPFLEEGLATAVEDSRSYAPLRTELASGNKTVPLLLAFKFGTLWGAGDYGPIELGYLEASSIVKFVLDRWGPSKLHTWVVKAANTNLSDAAVERSVRDVLGVGWTTFVRQWRAYVQALP